MTITDKQVEAALKAYAQGMDNRCDVEPDAAIKDLIRFGMRAALEAAEAASPDLCERICAAIQAADDNGVDEADYMLDSKDCIRIVREQFAVDPSSAEQPADELHPKTRDLVARFSVAMADKLLRAQRKYGYSDGWADSGWLDECRQHLRQHVEKGDPLDVANYCAFLWHHGASTAAPGAPEAAERARFEAWANPRGFNFDKIGDDYVEWRTTVALQAWQARAKSSAAPSVAPFGYVDPSAKYSAVAFAFESHGDKVAPVYLAPVSARDGEAVDRVAWFRAQGWAVAVHNDYRLNGDPHTFWLFTRGQQAIKGEGRTDADALRAARAEAEKLATPPADARDGDDARRYRWLRAWPNNVSGPHHGVAGLMLREEYLDAAIDRAMGGE